MLTESQITDVWEGRLSSETRSLYFGDLASVYSNRKQWITGISFFLSSGAAATLIAKSPVWVPIVLSVAVAVITAYAVGVNLDSKIRTMSKLHYAWNQMANDYTRLWAHLYDDDSENTLDELCHRQLDLSELATTDAPNDEKRMSRWQEQVFKLHRLTNA